QNATIDYTTETNQQLKIADLRAVEHGRATVQISTVGVSGVISPNVVLMDTSELFTADRFATTLPLRTSLTVADRLGWWPTIVVGAFAVVSLLAGAGATIRARGQRRSR